jgi:hypothetical protein
MTGVAYPAGVVQKATLARLVLVGRGDLETDVVRALQAPGKGLPDV